MLDILVMIHYETGCWREIATLPIPGKNDFDKELKALSCMAITGRFAAFRKPFGPQRTPIQPHGAA